MRGDGHYEGSVLVAAHADSSRGVVFFLPFLPLVVRWRWDWWEAWAYGISMIVGFGVSRALAARRHSDLLPERGRMLDHENADPWDKWLAPALAFGGSLFIPLVARFDARFGRPGGFDLPAMLAAGLLIVAGYVLGSYAMIENRYFSGVVRLQTERGHRVVSSGPYRWIRHPGYTGTLVAYAATPVLLGSPWAFIPAILTTIVLFVRSALEDRTLQEKLPGYREYALRVRYRLLPGVW